MRKTVTCFRFSFLPDEQLLAETRWNAIYKMLHRVLEQKTPLVAAMTQVNDKRFKEIDENGQSVRVDVRLSFAITIDRLHVAAHNRRQLDPDAATCAYLGLVRTDHY
jgi:hypothetical protein